MRHRPGRLPASGGRRRAGRDRPQEPDPGDRRHPLPAEVHLRRDRRRLCGRAGEPRQHQGVRRPCRRGRQSGWGGGHPDPYRRQRRIVGQAVPGEVRQGHSGGPSRVRDVGGLAVRGARFRRHQDQRQAQRPGRDGRGLPVAGREDRLPLAPRCDRGRPGVPRHHQIGGRLRRPAVRGHRRHHPGLAVGAAGGRGEGRQPDPRVAEPAPAPTGDRVLSVLRTRPGRRLQTGQRRERRTRGSRRAVAGGGDGLRGQRTRRGPRGRSRRRLG